MLLYDRTKNMLNIINISFPQELFKDQETAIEIEMIKS